jgi:hypothetical protein
MKTEKMNEMFKMLNEMLSLRENMEKLSSRIEENMNDSTRCPLEEELENDYNDIISWTFGEREFPILKKGKAIEIWKSLHPDLPVPRVLKTTVEDMMSNSLGLLIDVIPLYFEEKKRKCKCANAS